MNEDKTFHLQHFENWSESQQLRLDLFSEFFVSDEKWSQSLELWDSVPKFNHTHIKRFKTADVLTRQCIHRGKEYEVKISAASLEIGDETFMAYPNQREEIVLHVLRYMAAQQVSPAFVGTFVQDEQQLPCVVLTFTIHQLRKQLSAIGHGYKWSEIVQSLEILSGAILTVRYGRYKARGTFLQNVASHGEKGEQIWRVSFHELAAQAIHSGATRRIRYDHLMALKSPLSRWIYIRLCHLTTNAASPTVVKKGIGFSFGLEEIYTQSGVAKLSQRRDNVRKVREALKELLKANLLHSKPEFGEGFIEDDTAKEIRWTVYPSSQTVTDIITASKNASFKSHEAFKKYLKSDDENQEQK